MTKKKRKNAKWLLIISLLIVFTLLAWNTISRTHYIYHLYPYHHKGNIKVYLNGEDLDIDGTEITLYLAGNGRDSRTETKKLHGGDFKFKSGEYGPNEMFLTLSKDIHPELEKDLQIKLSNFNTNNWHVFKYTIEIRIDTSGSEPIAVLNFNYTILGEDNTEPIQKESTTYNLSESNYKIVYDYRT